MVGYIGNHIQIMNMDNSCDSKFCDDCANEVHGAAAAS